MGDRNSKTGQDCSILHVLPIAYCLAPIAQCSSNPNARICHCIHNISQKISNQRKKSSDDEDAHDGWVVPCHYAHVEKLTHPGNGKNGLKDDASAYKAWNRQPQYGNDRQEGVSQRMFSYDYALWKSLSPGSGYIFLPQYLEEAAFHITGNSGEATKG